MTERPQLLKIVAHPFGDEARAFNLIGLPKLQLRLQPDDGKVEKGFGKRDGLLAWAGVESCMIASV